LCSKLHARSCLLVGSADHEPQLTIIQSHSLLPEHTGPGTFVHILANDPTGDVVLIATSLKQRDGFAASKETLFCGAGKPNCHSFPYRIDICSPWWYHKLKM
jgi:hypothetical protein